MAVRTRNRGLIRQGDVLLIPIQTVPGETTVSAAGTRVVLAEGEATGHAHAVVADEARLVEAVDGTLYLVLAGANPAALVHEEHDTIGLAPGAYEVRRQREYIPATRRDQAFRRVAD